MNNISKEEGNQELKESAVKKTRAQYRREEKARNKEIEKNSKRKDRFAVAGAPISNEEFNRKRKEFLGSLKSRTWRHLETGGKVWER